MSIEQLTVDDVLTLIAKRAQQCREEGDGDMLNIMYAVSGVRDMRNEGKSRDEILAVFAEEDEDA